MSKKDNRIEVISRAVLRRGSKILLCQALPDGYYYLPGGHVEFGETAAHALQREFHEECALQITVKNLLLACENHFRQRARNRHEILFVFHVEHRGATPPPENVVSREDGIAFHWIDIAALPDVDLRPDVLKAWLMTAGPQTGAEWISCTNTAADSHEHTH